jgi:hypothetical protein
MYDIFAHFCTPRNRTKMGQKIHSELSCKNIWGTKNVFLKLCPSVKDIDNDLHYTSNGKKTSRQMVAAQESHISLTFVTWGLKVSAPRPRFPSGRGETVY